MFPYTLRRLELVYDSFLCDLEAGFITDELLTLWADREADVWDNREMLEACVLEDEANDPYDPTAPAPEGEPATLAEIDSLFAEAGFAFAGGA